MDCVYRGEPIGEMRGDDNAPLKVYQCDLFQRCVLKDGTSQRFCGTCESRLELVYGQPGGMQSAAERKNKD